MRTLVIDSAWKPISFIRDQRAIVMALTGKVEIVTVWEEKINSATAQIDVPAIVRLKKYISKISGTPRFRRKILFSRDNYQCQYCGKNLSWNTATIDHVVPRCKGGKTSWQNCVLACFPCNEKKGNKSLLESGLALKNNPAEPKPQHYWRAHDYSVCNRWHPEWEFFLGSGS